MYCANSPQLFRFLEVPGQGSGCSPGTLSGSCAAEAPESVWLWGTRLLVICLLVGGCHVVIEFFLIPQRRGRIAPPIHGDLIL